MPAALRPLLLLACLLGCAATRADSAPAGCPPPAPAPAAGAIEPPLRDLGVLWRIERDGVPASHVLGTIHLDDPAVTTLPAPVEAAFARSRALVVEVRLDAAANDAYRQAMEAPDGARLDAALGPEVYARYVAIAGAYHLPEAFAARLRPWAATNLVGRPPPRTGIVLDEVLLRTAEALGRPVHGLETMAELVATLDALPPADQVEVLRDTVCQHETILAQVPDLRRMYLQRDLAGLWRQGLAPAAGPAVQARFLEALLYARSARMAQRLEPHLQAGGAFVAVGALHLPGRRGLLELLAARGWRVGLVY